MYKKIPDATIVNSAIRLLSIIKSLTIEEKDVMVGLALKYSIATRPLFGDRLESIGDMDSFYPCKNHLTREQPIRYLV